MRTDIPVADQIVQAGHACLEAGARFGLLSSENFLVVLAVNSQEQLLEIRDDLDFAGVRSAMFFEPDEDMGYTAFCTEPLEEGKRRLFRRYKLWHAETECASACQQDLEAVVV